jgi:hypothetical protein
MWVVESPSPGSSALQTPHLAPAHGVLPSPNLSLQISNASLNSAHSAPHSAGLQHTPTAPARTTVTAGTIPRCSISGRLTGVVSLTDILNTFAKASGLHPLEPSQMRRQRCRSSSASLGLRRSVESSRSASASESGAGGDKGSRRESMRGRR